MKCIKCGADIIVAWMKCIGEESLENAANMDMGYDPIKDAEPWPEYRCGCHADNKPMLSYEDFLVYRDSSLFDEYGSGLDIEPHYVAMFRPTHRPQEAKKLADVVESNDYEKVKKSMAERLFELYGNEGLSIDIIPYIDPPYNDGKLYRDTNFMYDEATKNHIPIDVNKALLSTADPQDRYTFDNDWEYYVENVTRWHNER